MAFNSPKTLITAVLWIKIFPPLVFLMMLMTLFPASIRYKNKIFFSLSSWTSWFITRFTFIKITTHGKIPHGQFIFVANHSSNMDGLLIESLLESQQRIWLFKSSLASIPILGFALKRMHTPVLRDKGHEAAKALIKSIRLAKKHQSSLILFPEGTRYHDDKIHKFNQGFARASTKLSCPVLPIAILNSDKILEPESWLIDSSNCNITLIVGEPMKPKQDESEEKFALRVQKWFIDTVQK